MDPPEGWSRHKYHLGDEDQWSHIPSKKPRSEYVDKKAYGQVHKWELPQDKTNLQTATLKWQMAAFEPTAAGDGQSDKEETDEELPSEQERHKKWEHLPRTRTVKPQEESSLQAIQVSEQAVKLTSKQLEILMKWWALMERFHDQSELAQTLLVDPKVEPLRLLQGTFAPREDYHQGYLNIITSFLAWSASTMQEEDPWTREMCYKFLVQINLQKKAGTYAGRFTSAFTFFTVNAEILTKEETKKIMQTPSIKKEVAKCRTRKASKREATPLSMAMVENIEERVFDETRTVEERSVWGFVLFMTYSRFRAKDAARIPIEPYLESNSIQGLIVTTTLSHLMKNGQRDERRGIEMTITAHAVGLTGKRWGKEWLRLRELQGLDAVTWGRLQPNIDHKWQPLEGTTMTADKVTWLIRQVASEMEMTSAEISKMSSHSCKPTWLTVLSKRGIQEEIRRRMGYHASGRAQCVELYARNTWTHPMRILGAVLEEIRSGIFRPDRTHSERYLPGYEPFQIVFDCQVPALPQPEAEETWEEEPTVEDDAMQLLLAVEETSS